MARSFRGEYHQKVDTKGRVSIPFRYRRIIEAGDPDCTDGKRPSFVIVYGDHLDNHLECYTIDAAAAIEEDIRDMPPGEDRSMFEDFVLNMSIITEIDDDGRIVLPQKQRQKIGLRDEAYFVSRGECFQIWDRATYDAEMAPRKQAWLAQKREERGPNFDIKSLLPRRQRRPE